MYFDPWVLFNFLSKLGTKENHCSVDKLRDKLATLLLLDGGLRVNELCKVFVENIKLSLEDQKAEIKVSWTKEACEIKWTWLTFHCSCRRQNLDSKRSDGDLLRASCCSYCVLISDLEHKTAIFSHEHCPQTLVARVQEEVHWSWRMLFPFQ